MHMHETSSLTGMEPFSGVSRHGTQGETQGARAPPLALAEHKIILFYIVEIQMTQPQHPPGYSQS